MRRGIFGLVVGLASMAASAMPWSEVAFRSASNVGLVGEPVKGIVVEHHGCGCSQCGKEKGKSVTDFVHGNIRGGWVFIHPRTGSNWMNESAAKLTDELVDALIEHYRLPKDVPILSTGYSMGGMGALVWPAFSKHKANVRAIFANCPVTDLEEMHRYASGTNAWATYIRTSIERAYPRQDGRPYAEILRSRSPIDILDRLIDVPYYVNQGTADEAVVKEKHADVFVPALKAKGRNVTYYVSEGIGHVGFSKDVRPKWDAALGAEQDRALKICAGE